MAVTNFKDILLITFSIAIQSKTITPYRQVFHRPFHQIFQPVLWKCTFSNRLFYLQNNNNNNNKCSDKGDLISVNFRIALARYSSDERAHLHYCHLQTTLCLSIDILKTLWPKKKWFSTSFRKISGSFNN